MIPPRDIAALALVGTVCLIMLIVSCGMVWFHNDVKDNAREIMQILVSNLIGIASGYVLGRTANETPKP